MRDKWGEYTGDYTQLTYLRSRYYSSGTGRFLTRDTWSGDANSPMSYNKWNYVSGNPINSIDPTGMCDDVGDGACWALYNEVIRWRPDLANANMYVSIYEEGIPLHRASYQQLKFILDNQLWSICLFTPPTKAENSTLYTSCHAISWVNKHRAEIVSAAQRNGVPPELPAGILASEIDFDTDLVDIMMDTGFRSHTTEITLAELALIFSTHKPLGPGTANIHFATWLTAQNYFQYCGYLPSVITDAGNPQSSILSIVKWVEAMETPSGAIEGSAVLSRFFADYRTGSGGQPNRTTHFNDLNTKDMALIFVAYRAGIGGLTCFTNGDAKGDYDCGYANVGVFQEETSLTNRFNGQQSLPYFDFFRRYFEYFRLKGE